jgi:tRNA-splicing ligase RtcB
LLGTNEAEYQSFGSTAHGAGRVMSRKQALRCCTGQEVKDDLMNKNILVKSSSIKGIAEEAPIVYKDIDEVIEVTKNSNIAKPVVRLRPLGVIKG